MKDCPFKQYCNDDCENCTDKDKADKINNIKDVIQPVVANIVETLTLAIQQTIQKINHLWRTIIECYPDKRVVHLAIHHKKSRVRKKNIKRIMKWINSTHAKGKEDCSSLKNEMEAKEDGNL